MNTLKRLFMGLLFSIPVVGIHVFIVTLLKQDTRAVEVLKTVGYGALGLYAAIICLLLILFVGSTGLMSLRYFFNIRLKENNTDKNENTDK